MTAAVVAGLIAEQMLGRRSLLAAALAGLLCLLSFHTQFVVISGDTEGVSWLMMALAFFAYLRGVEWAIGALLALAAVQREAMIVAMGSIALVDLLRARGVIKPMQVRVVAYAGGVFRRLFRASPRGTGT